MVRKSAAIIAATAIGTLAIAQVIPGARTNPPSKGDPLAASEVNAILRNSCYDCHSNETRWPWYSRIAPFSWVIVHHVDLGRSEVNFSEWNDYYPHTRQRKLEWMKRALEERLMPPCSYTLMHPGARLSADDRARLQRWIEGELATTANGSPG